jgi:hypothetical protein
MPSVRMRTSSAGPAGNRSAGNVYPVDPDEGAELVAGGFAEWVDPPKHDERKIETAERPSPEHAAVLRRRR